MRIVLLIKYIYRLGQYLRNKLLQHYCNINCSFSCPVMLISLTEMCYAKAGVFNAQNTLVARPSNERFRKCTEMSL